MMVIGLWQIAATPRTGIIGFEPVHPSTREIREHRDIQEYRLLIGVVGLILFHAGSIWIMGSGCRTATRPCLRRLLSARATV